MNSILIIDDEQSIRDMLAAFLGRQGYKTRLAADGQSGMLEIANEQPDIVLLDLMLPKEDGMAVLEQIRGIDPDITVIMLTGYGSVQNAVQAMKLGAFDFLTKPFTFDDLMIVLHRAGEMASLRREQARLKTARAKYFDLYEQAPIGYLTLNPQGLIVEANRTAAQLLGVEKNLLLNQPLARFVLRDDQPIFDRHRQQLAGQQAGSPGPAETPAVCELRMVRHDGAPFWAHLESSAVQADAGAPACWIILSDITPQRRLEKAREEQQQARHLTAISRELHDGLGGLAANAGILAELGRRQAAREEDRKIFQSLADVAREMNSEIHGLMNTLESRDIQWSDMIEEFRQYGSGLMAAHGIEFDLHVTGNSETAGPQLLPYSSLSRIYKEALTNIIKHSRAAQAQVAMQFNPSRLSLEIGDNGRGFAADHAPGRGLGNMRTRAAEMGGALRIQSQGGVRLRFEFPIPLQWVEKEAAGQPA